MRSALWNGCGLRQSGTATAEPIAPVGRKEEYGYIPLTIQQESAVADDKSDILQGTLDLMVLKTLDAMGPMHGYGVARRIEQISEEALQINQGTIYLCLIRLVQKGWIDSAWGTSENNRKARFYSISRSGKKQLAAETRNWERVAGVIGRVLQLAPRKP
jgi:transcriptional regulator